MSKKPTLAALKQQIDDERRPQVVQLPAQHQAAADDGDDGEGEEGRVIRGKRYPTYREGKVPISGYFSFELSAALHQLANEDSLRLRKRVKIQELLGEAIDMLLESRGKHKFGER
jgi:hypothetical protein